MTKTAFKAAFASLFVTAFGANAAVVQLNSTADMTTTYLNDFESVINSGPVAFEGTAQLGHKSSWTGNVTPSGDWGLVEAVRNDPLTAQLSSKYHAVGLHFGNDDFGYAFNVTLSIFDGAVNLGSVSLVANKNDYADQFLGLSSTLAFDRVQVSYQRPDAQQLSIFIDDFRLGTPAVPEPSTYALLAAGLGAIGVVARRRKQS